MAYPVIPDLQTLARQIGLYIQLQHEQGAGDLDAPLRQAQAVLEQVLREIQARPIDKALAAAEPDDLNAIHQLRPAGPRRLWKKFDAKAYAERLPGALLARMAGCTLGAPVEGWPVERMRDFAKTLGDQFPPTDYWSAAWSPQQKRYGASVCADYTRGAMNGVPVDDDIVYTLLGLLIVEDTGPDFSVDDVGRAWVKYLPIACTAEDIALKNLKAGLPAAQAALKGNPYIEWIGADIRADPFGYLAPGWPEKAARMAYHDAYISHRRNGIYGEMFFAAATAAAFAVDEPLKAIEIGLSEIPRDCRLAQDVRWALAQCGHVKDYADARARVDERFAGMSNVHTNNNACLSIFGLAIGGRDVTRVIGETVAMGLDNDCTAATAGSMVGAVVGKSGVPAQWTRPFHNTVHSYLIGHPRFAIDDLLARFTKQAQTVHAGH